MDYLLLLRKYVDHVGQCEGIVFLRDQDRSPGFTDEEWTELQRIEYEPLVDEMPRETE